MPLSTDWMRDGACVGTPDDMVPPDIGGQVRRAKRHCVECPVQRDCLRYALGMLTQENVALEGVWGGLTMDERRRLLAGNRLVMCKGCVTLFVGVPGKDRCDGCSRGEVMARVEEQADKLRALILEQGMTVVAAAAALGVSKDSATAWAAEHLGLARDRMGDNGRRIAPCGTSAARKRHARDRRRANLSEDLSGLTCACADLVKPPTRQRAACGTETARERHLRERKRDGRGGDLSDLTCACADLPRRGDLAPCGTDTAKRRHREQMRKAGLEPTLYGLTCECAPSRPKPKKNDGQSGNERLGMAA
jgi:hypothetical protein